MIQKEDNAAIIKRAIQIAGINFVVAVPDEWSKDLLAQLETARNLKLTYATREEEGIGIAVGAQMGGKNTAVIMQTSGLGNSINALASLNLVYRIPVLLLASFRGGPGEEFYHKLYIGLSVRPILSSLGIPCYELESASYATSVIPNAFHQAKNSDIPVTVLIHKRALVGE